MPLRYALLALLADGEAHGYALLKRFAQRLGPYWQPNVGQIYQLLRELEARGLVAGHDAAAGTRNRRLFRLTPRGERALDTWLGRRPGWPPPLRDEIFIRMLAAERRGPAAMRTQLERQASEYRRYLHLVREHDDVPDAGITRRLADEAARAHAHAYLEWIARCRSLLPGSDDDPVVS